MDEIYSAYKVELIIDYLFIDTYTELGIMLAVAFGQNPAGQKLPRSTPLPDKILPDEKPLVNR